MIIYTLSLSEIKSRDEQIEEYISRISKGDASALDGLYKLIETDVFAYALSKTANKEDAEDITHDTFVCIYKNASQYTPMGKPMAWIITLELNLIRRHYNLRKRTAPFDESTVKDIPCEDFSQSVINNEFLRQLLKILTEEEREIISLHIVSGFKHREIAKLLGKPLSTVLSKYNRAIKKLKLQVKEKEEI